MAKKASTKTTKTVKSTKPVKTTKATKPVVKTSEPVKAPNPPKKKKSKAWIPIVAVVGALVLAGAGFVAYVLLNEEHSEPAKQSATVTLDQESRAYGSFTALGGKSFDIKDYIGKNEFKISFYPSEAYKERNFSITVGDGKKFTADYIKEETKIEFNGVNGYKLKDKDELKISLELVVGVSTFTLSNKNYGSLTDGDIVDISQYIGDENPNFNISFTPSDEYKDSNFNISLGEDDSRFKATYVMNNNDRYIHFEAKEGNIIQDGDAFIATLTEQPVGFTVTLNADEGIGHFNKGVDDIERSVSGISEGTTFGDVLKEIDESPILDVDLGESKPRLTGGKFAYYVDGNGNTISDGYKISGNLNVTARYSLDCFGLENTSNDTTIHLTLTNGSTGTATNPPEVYYTIESDSSTYLKNWTEWNYAENTIAVEAGKKVYFKGNNPNGFSNFNYYSQFTFKLTDATLPQGTKVLAHGNIMSLIDDGTCTTTTIPGNGSCFNKLFFQFTQLDIASDFSMPAVTLANSCYADMFNSCESLTTMPDLSSVKKGSTMSFQYMFNNCKKLVSIEANKFPDFDKPEDMGVQMCQGMFQNCGKMGDTLLDIDITPLTKFNMYPNNCFTQMFYLSSIGRLKVGFGNPNNPAFWPTGATAGNNPTKEWLEQSDPGLYGTSTFIWKGVTKDQLDSSLLDDSHIRNIEAWKVEVYE